MQRDADHLRHGRDPTTTAHIILVLGAVLALSSGRLYAQTSKSSARSPGRSPSQSSGNSPGNSTDRKAGASRSSKKNSKAEKKPLKPDRFEFGALPAFASSSDFGVGGGVIGHVTKFATGYYPYRWRAGALVFVAGQRVPGSGAEVSLQFHRLELDFPQLGHKRVRVSLVAQYYGQPNSGYYGIGNRTGVDLEARARDRRYYQYAIDGVVAQPFVRFRLSKSWHSWVKAEISYRSPNLHPGSKLEQDYQESQLDTARGRVLRGMLNGLQPHFLTIAQTGLLYDTRDHEFAPTRGMFHELSGRVGRIEGKHYAGVSATARFYKALWRPHVVLALRLGMDRNYGAAPLSRLSSIHGLLLYSAPGSAFAVRGVPEGRYHGMLRFLGNLEVRTSFLPFTLWRQRFLLGAVAFIDAGRVWADPGRADDFDRVPLPADGLQRSATIKYAFGGGTRVQWGDTFVVRADLGLSPDGTGYILSINHHF